MSDNKEMKTKDTSIFDIDGLVKDTYNSIANWHNEESSSASLKQLSLEIVEKIAGATLKHVGLNGNLSIHTEEVPKDLI